MEKKRYSSLSHFHEIPLFFLFCLVNFSARPPLFGAVGRRRENGSRKVSRDWCHCGDLPPSELDRCVS